MPITDKWKRGWNAFVNNRDPTYYKMYGGTYGSTMPDRRIPRRKSGRTIAAAIFNRIAVDCAQVNIRHVNLDDNNRYLSERDSGLNNCLSLEANVDQTGRELVQDIVQSCIDEGVIAVAPTIYDLPNGITSPDDTDAYDIIAMRVGKIVEWFPRHVKVRVYNDTTGNFDELMYPKRRVAIIKNPFYETINAENSVLDRLMSKLSLLDAIDEAGVGKLDLVIQLPYAVRTDNRKLQAKERQQDLAAQLANSKYGVAYIDSTEKITQLNRPLENNLMKQIEYLYDTFYSQIGISKSIMDGTADEQTKLNYQNCTIEAYLSTIVNELKRKFISKTGRTQGQSIMYFIDPFRLLPVTQVAELADKLTRNEIMTSNEIRQIIGMKPSTDPSADELRNKNLSQAKDATVESLEERLEAQNQNEYGQV